MTPEPNRAPHRILGNQDVTRKQLDAAARLIDETGSHVGFGWTAGCVVRSAARDSSLESRRSYRSKQKASERENLGLSYRI